MASTILVDIPLDAGWRLLDLLDAVKPDLQIMAAFWKYDEEREDWRFYLASPRVGTEGSLALLRQIQPLLEAMSQEEREGLRLEDFALVRPDQPIIRDMARRHGAVQGKRGGVVRRSDLMRDEAFIYRL